NFIVRVRTAPPTWYVAAIVILYVPTFLLGAWVYIKYRTYVRIPMEQNGHWWTVGAFEFKEHQGAYRVDGHGSAAGLLVRLAATAFRRVCHHAQVADDFLGGRRVV